MIAIPALLFALACCVLVEKLIKSVVLRVVAVFILIVITAAVSGNIGVQAGKALEQSRFARLLPNVWARVDQYKSDPAKFQQATQLLKEGFSRPQDLEEIELRLIDLKEIEADKPAAQAQRESVTE